MDHVHHRHEQAGHTHQTHSPATRRAMNTALLLTMVFAALEAVAGYWSGSLALVSDAGHMVSDALSLGLGSFAVWMGSRPPSQRHSYGMQRAEVIAAFLNGLLLLVVILGLVFEAVRRLSHPEPVMGLPVMAVAVVGLLLNLRNGWVLSRAENSLNTRAAMVHVVTDLLGSLAALIAGAVVWFFGWMLIDPLLSLFVSALMLYSSIRIIRESLHVLMEGVPDSISLRTVGDQLESLPGVEAVHDLHIWTLTSGMVALSAHLEVASLEVWPEILARAQSLLAQQDILHVTLQPEISRMPRPLP
jgi:cobalt-zinc-cadmium efflux system protein